MIDWSERRAQELAVPIEDYRDWRAGKRVPSVESAMLRETDEKRLNGNAQRVG